MGNPRGKKNLVLTARILFTMQPCETPRLANVMHLVTEMGKLVRQVRDEVRGLQRRSMPQAPPEAEKPDSLEGPEGPKDRSGPREQ